MIYKIGLLIDIPADIKEETMMKGLRGEQRDHVVGFSRVYKSIRTNSGIRDFPSSKVKVICKGEIPKFLIFFGLFQFVNLFVQPVLRCRKCNEYGHGFKNCGNNGKCSFCGGPHEREFCDTETLICSSCHLEHAAKYAHTLILIAKLMDKFLFCGYINNK